MVTSMTYPFTLGKLSFKSMGASLLVLQRPSFETPSEVESSLSKTRFGVFKVF